MKAARGQVNRLTWETRRAPLLLDAIELALPSTLDLRQWRLPPFHVSDDEV